VSSLIVERIVYTLQEGLSVVTVNGTLECYILGDQPTTCGLCGARTDFVVEEDDTQIHQCLNRECRYQFIAVSEADE
jgi:hypothetical protein